MTYSSTWKAGHRYYCMSAPLSEGVPSLECVLHDQSSGDGRNADPLLVSVKYLERLDPGFLPQHRETLWGSPLNKNTFDRIVVLNQPCS